MDEVRQQLQGIKQENQDLEEELRGKLYSTALQEATSDSGASECNR
jgi:hypothetical protein